MLERIKQIPGRLLEIWRKYTKRQKTIIVSAVGTVLLTLVILIVLLNRIQYEDLYTFEDTKTAKTAIDVLTENGVEYQLKEDGVTVAVNLRKKQDAILLLSDSEVMSEQDFGLKELLANDLSTTSSDKMLKNHLYMQDSLAAKIREIQGVDKASVSYFPTDTQNAILQETREMPCSIKLIINDDFNKKQSPLAIATLVAYAIGNTSTDKIKVIDQFGEILFGAPVSDGESEALNKNLEYKAEVTAFYENKLFELAIINDFSNAVIVPNLSINMDQESSVYTEFLAAEGQEQGLYDTFKQSSSTNTQASGDIPGTDSNDEVEYYLPTTNSGNSSTDDLEIKYKPSERVTKTMKEWGVIDLENSSMAITLAKVRTQTEEDLEVLGLLDNVSFEEYVANNSEKRQLEVPQEFFELFSSASGIPVEGIRITAYEYPNYIAASSSGMDWAFYLQILLAALILGLLGFVIFRGTKPEEIVETEPELSVERLLATTKENQSLEDIEFSEKSETRRMIEKFVEENPDAVANLLRNWLNDDDEWN